MSVKLEFTNKGVVLTDEELKKLNRVMMSASFITGMEDCPAKWMATRALKEVLDGQEAANPSSALFRGSLFHRVMELLFQEKQRGRAELKAALNQAVNETPYTAIKSDQPAQEWLKNTVRKYELLEPEVTRNQYHITGLERRIIGKLPGCKLTFIGFIDRLRKGERGLIIDDYKTGAKSKPFSIAAQSNKIQNLPEHRQQMLYTLLLEKYQERVQSAGLIFPLTGEVCPTPIQCEQLREEAITTAQAAEQRFFTCKEDNLFPYQPSVLCAWCPLAKVCPKANIINREKMVNAYMKQPEADLFTDYI